MALLYQKEGRIATITFNRPEAMNSMDPEQLEEFGKACTDFANDPEVWVGIVTGAGEKAFCAGADLKRLVGPAMIEKTYKMPPSIMRGIQVWKPLIAAINGACLGGGLEVALACDLRIASEKANFGNPEVRWGIIATWGGTQRVTRAVGRSAASEILLMGKIIDAQEALRIGLVNKVVPPAEVLTTAKQWAQSMCELGPLALQATKEAMLRGLDMSLEDGLRLELSLSDNTSNTQDARNGVKSFMERQKPTFQGK